MPVFPVPFKVQGGSAGYVDVTGGIGGGGSAGCWCPPINKLPLFPSVEDVADDVEPGDNGSCGAVCRKWCK